MKREPDPGTSPPSPSFRDLFDSNLEYVWNVLRRLGVPTADAEDVTHDVFLIVHRHLADYDPARPLRPWLFGICVRVASDYRRRAHHRREVTSDGHEPADDAAPVDVRIEQHQAQQLVGQALDTLPLEQRAVLVMHDLEEVAMPVVADALGIPLNTGYSRLRLARQAFAQAVQRLQARGRR